MLDQNCDEPDRLGDKSRGIFAILRDCPPAIRACINNRHEQ